MPSFFITSFSGIKCISSIFASDIGFDMKLGIKKELPVLAIVTGLGYLSAYMFQFGMLTYYGIPFEFISVDINSILFSIMIISFVYIFLLVPFYLLTATAVFEENKKIKGGLVFIGMELLLACILSFVSAKYIIEVKEPTIGFWSVFSKTLLLFSIIVFFLNVLVLFVRKVGKAIPEIYKHVALMAYSPATIAVPFLCGLIYSDLHVGASFYKGTDYFLVLENPKGIIIAKCNEKKGISYKRLNSNDVEFDTNYNRLINKSVESCVKTWGLGGKKINSLHN
ncbi:MAG: hypothetical protein E7G42_21140 [Serratia marcescens]|uniref:hypothetical protein n=1 Tax=Serratia marcescens TaxID=615 RepID=UPI00290A82CC|nr:hypothetical protein [Serratia marcescens]MDU3852671.1 hypothetical protein [Serratia marcescens]